MSCTRRVPDDPWVEISVLGDTGVECDEFRTAEVRVAAQLGDGEPVSGMPSDS
jgi:hypothetical protein